MGGFHRDSEGTCIFFRFRLLRCTIGLKNSRHFVIQSEVEPKPIVTRSLEFSRAWRPLHVIALSCDWSIGFSVCFVKWFCFFDTQLKSALWWPFIIYINGIHWGDYAGKRGKKRCGCLRMENYC